MAGAMADILAETLTKHMAASAPAVAELRQLATTSIMENMESEMAPRMAAMFSQWTDLEHMPPFLREVISAGSEPKHQVDLIIQIASAFAVVLGGFQMLAGPALQRVMNQAWAMNAFVPLSPEVLAQAVVRGQIGFGAAADEARKVGLDSPNFEIMYNLAGNPPAPQELLVAFRRGIIDANRLAHGIRQSLLRDEWIDVIEALQFEPMSTGVAIEAAVQGHLSQDEARTIARQNGLKAEHFKPMFDTAGSPPGIRDVLELWNRGEISRADARQAIEESPFKPVYTDLLLKLAVQLPPREAIVLMISRGVIDHNTAVHKFKQLGYSDQDATFLTQEAFNRKMTPERDLTKSEITSLYTAGLLDRARTHEFLTKLGFSNDEAEMIINLVDAGNARRVVQTAQSKVHSLYIGYRIERPEASSTLDGLGVRPDVRDQLLRVWTLERDSNAKDLTLAQLTAAFKADLISRDEYLGRVSRLGYTDDDALLLGELAIPSQAQ